MPISKLFDKTKPLKKPPPLPRACAVLQAALTPSALTSLTFTPPTQTITPPGATSAVEVSFSPVSTDSYQPSAVTLANPSGAGTLTLGQETISGLQATATAVYTVNDEQQQVVVVADVVGEVQLVLDTSDDDDSCPYVPALGTELRRSLHEPDLHQRSYQILESSVNQGLITQAMTDARTILTAAYARLSTIVNNNNDIGFTKWFPKSQSALLLGMIAAQLRVLNTADSSIQAVFSSLDERPSTALSWCDSSSGPVTAYTFHTQNFPSRPGTAECNVQGWTLLCAKWFQNYQPLTGSLIKKKLGGGCKSDSVMKALQKNTFDFSTMYGSGARGIIHELTHHSSVCAAIPGWKTNKAPSCNTAIAYEKEVYDRTRMIGLVSSFNQNNKNDFVLYNADNYALAIMEWYIRDQCGMNALSS